MKQFYGKIIQIDTDDITDANMLTSAKIMEISKRIRQKNFRKRILGRANFELTTDMKIGIKL